MTDQIDLTTVEYHGSPNVSGWPITLALRGVEFKPGRPEDGNTCGVRPIFDRTEMNARWPDVKPVGWDGFIQFTIWAFVFVNGKWHGAGLHEFWSNRNGDPRIWTGAPILTQWSDWVYRNQWGPEMERYVPKVGDPIGFMLTAGDRRLMDLGDVRERTQVIVVPLAVSGVAEVTTTAPPVVVNPPTPPVTPPTPPVPTAPTGPVVDIEARQLIQDVSGLLLKHTEEFAAFKAQQAKVDAKQSADLAETNTKVDSLSTQVSNALATVRNAGGFLSGLFTRRG